MKIKQIFWIIFVLNLIYSVVVVNFLPFKSPGEKTGFILSCIVLFVVSYGVFLFFPRLIRLMLNKLGTKSLSEAILSVSLLVFPLIGIVGALDILIRVVPQEYVNENYMSLNGISMAAGMLLGSIGSELMIRKNNYLNSKVDPN